MPIPKNKGTAVDATLVFFLPFITPRISRTYHPLLVIRQLRILSQVADLLALSVIAAMDACGGPEIPFRWGRVDNFTPSPPGVPEPHQDLQTHISAFSRMGFTKGEMIGLVACGHSIGGVHHNSFPG
jgi:catalase (peroxidase I)